ncbi:helix-turn-helix transcriptional regulator [Clostridioides difficile]|nr:helix-turn-helix transcriptional regulator [Clostridioides difficile]MBT2158716.1 helix-turn-helix transcriptional regulator [Clostridioides difficile]MBT2158750.1 helix-turn-helix transcriptional regulator [Clostridioides difficile]
MNISKLKGKMVEKKYTQKKLAEELGMTVQALNAKLNNRSQFKIEEAVKISNILQIEEPGEIFLTIISQKCNEIK